MKGDKAPIASVVVMNYNGRKYLEDCLNSILNQEFDKERYEIFFVDNASTDDSVRFVKKSFPSINVVELDKNYGLAGGNNRSVEYTKGKYIIFLDNDTIMHRKWLSELVKIAEDNPSAALCVPNLVEHDCPDWGPMEMEKWIDHIYFLKLSRFGWAKYTSIPFAKEPLITLFAPGPSTLIRREIIDELEYVFDPEFFNGGDLDLSLRMTSLGHEIMIVPTSIVYHDISSKYFIKNRARIAAVIKIYDATKYRFITYFKHLHTLEFLLFLPFLLFGAPFKASEIKINNKAVKIIYGILSIPIIIFSFIMAVSTFPKFIKKRRAILSKRKKKDFWYIKKILGGQFGQGQDL